MYSCKVYYFLTKAGNRYGNVQFMHVDIEEPKAAKKAIQVIEEKGDWSVEVVLTVAVLKNG